MERNLENPWKSLSWISWQHLREITHFALILKHYILEGKSHSWLIKHLTKAEKVVLKMYLKLACVFLDSSN